MAVMFGTGAWPSLLSVTKTLDPDGNTAKIVELLQQTNQPLLDIPWKEGNLPDGERTTIRTGLPVPIFRKWYQGVPVTKSNYAQITDTCADLQARHEVDKKAAEFNGNSDSFRMIEALGEIEGMNQAQMTALMYGDSTLNPEQYNGLAPRFSSLSAGNGQNIIDAGGTGADNMSIWLVCWGLYTVFGVYPKGSKGGLSHQDLGEIDCFDVNGDKFRGYADIWDWECGLCVKDWRYIVRIANIDASDLIAQNANAANLVTLMVKALHRVPNLGIVQTGIENAAQNGAAGIPLAPNPVFYCNRTAAEYLDIESLNKTQYTLKSGNDVFGRPITFCRGIPVRTCDQLTSGEARVT